MIARALPVKLLVTTREERNRMMPRTNAFAWIAGITLVFCCAVAGAQPWPARPVRIVVPYAPGGTIDIIARQLGEELFRSLGRPLIVENRAGAGGVVGTEYVARQPADGYTILLTTVSHTLTPSLQKLAFDAEHDFVPVIHIADSPQVLFRHPSFPAHSLHQLIRLAGSKPGSLSYAHGGPGSPANIAAELLKSMARIDMVAIPYKGAGPVVTDVMAGQVALGIGSLPAVQAFLKAGRLHAIGVSTKQRTKSLPQVPTFEEQGVRGYEFNTWFGFLAGRGTPPAIVDRLAETTDLILRRPEVRDSFSNQGADPVGGGPGEFDRLLKAEFARWPMALHNAGIKGDR